VTAADASSRIFQMQDVQRWAAGCHPASSKAKTLIPVEQ